MKISKLERSQNFVERETAEIYFCKLVPELAEPMQRWESSRSDELQLTSVGIAIAIANIRHKIGHEFDLEELMD